MISCSELEGINKEKAMGEDLFLGQKIRKMCELHMKLCNPHVLLGNNVCFGSCLHLYKLNVRFIVFLCNGE